MKLLEQLFRGTNGNYDLARIIGAKAALVYPFPFVFNAIAKHALPDPAGFGTGYAAVLLAIGGLIGAKELAVAKATATTPST